jgi:hypothetical protein
MRCEGVERGTAALPPAAGLDPATPPGPALVVRAPGGEVEWSVRQPCDPGLLGLRSHAQAAILEPADGLHLSGVLTEVVR